MIAFASLFLGLFLGIKPVEVVVGEGVAAVELRLDGETVGVIEGPPWVLDCDFGTELRPAHLEAIALDAGEREIARVEQWLNLPQPRVVITAAIEPPEEGKPRAARLSWESAAGATPRSVTATVDGMPIPIDDPHRLVLPPLDESQLHLLHVEMRFEDRATSRLDFTFGGIYVDQVSTEMTALPIYATSPNARPPALEALQTWFQVNGEPLRAMAIEHGPAEVVVVLGRPFPHFLDPGTRRKKIKNLDLPKGLGMRFALPVPEEQKGVANTFELFPISPVYGRQVADLYTLLINMMRPTQDRPAMPGSAVAIAGLSAYESRRRRAVILIPSAKAGGEDDLPPALARRYLERLHVPFFIWDPERKPTPGADAWGPVDSVASLGELAEALETIGAELDRQWIVWLDGQHLPQDVVLSPEAKGFVIPGASR